MAIIETGLGWYADENWLKRYSGEMGLCGILPFTESGELGRVSSANVVVFSAVFSGYTTNWKKYNNEEAFVVTIIDSNQRVFLALFSTSKEAAALNLYDGNTFVRKIEASTYVYKNYTYYGNLAGVFTADSYNVNYGNMVCTQNSELTSGYQLREIVYMYYLYDIIISGQNFYKMNSGYAISCFAHYLNSENKMVYAPILISSTPAYTNISQQDPEGGTATNISTRYTVMQEPMEITLGFGGEFEADSIEATGASVLEVGNTTPLPAPGAGLAGTLWTLIKNASSFGIGEYDNPYEGGGTSQPETGDGTFDFTSTPIALPGVPSIGGYDTGFTSIYNPTSAELKALANYMWAGAFDMENFRKLFSDPMDAIIGLSIIPLTMSQIAGVSSQLVVGNISTGITMKAVSVQYVQVDCGTIQVPSKWGAYLDYAPYTKLQLYLPYIGFVDIAPDDVMDGSIHVQYTVDLMSGTCIAHVMCKDHVLYAFGGNCSCPCPVTSGQYKNGAIGALEIVGTVASTAAQMTPGGKGVSAVTNTALDVFGSIQDMFKPAITRAGSIGSAVGLMGIQIPYLVLTVPRMCIPGEQNIYMGYPSFVTKVMGDLAGYTEIEVSHLNNMTCTQEEVSEIISLLGSGVIF